MVFTKKQQGAGAANPWREQQPLREGISGANKDRRLWQVQPKITWKTRKIHQPLEIKALVPKQIVDLCKSSREGQETKEANLEKGVTAPVPK